MSSHSTNLLINTPQIALIEYLDNLYYSEFKSKPFEPHSAVTQLIQGLYEKEPQIAYKILRKPILVESNPSILCRGMISICAKRFNLTSNLKERIDSWKFNKIKIEYQSKAFDDSGLTCDLNETPFHWHSDQNDNCKLNSQNFRFNFIDISSKKSNHENWNVKPKPEKIRALLLNSKKEVVGFARNQNKINKTFHAEVILLQDFYFKYKSGFNEDNHLITSLQCCKMCASMAWHMHADPLNKLHAYYLHPESGSASKDTPFSIGGNLRRELIKKLNLKPCGSKERVTESQITEVEFGIILKFNSWAV